MSAPQGNNRLTVLAADIRAAHAAIQASAETIAEQALIGQLKARHGEEGGGA